MTVRVGSRDSSIHRGGIIIKPFCAAVVAASLVPCSSALASPLPLDVLDAFDPAQGQIPESLTTDREGNIFFSWASTSTIQKRAPDGAVTTFGTLPIPVFTLGVKVGPDRCVYTVSTSLTATVGAFVWRICAAGMVEQVAALDPSGGPNDLAFDREGNLYVTDPFLGRIDRVDPRGTVTLWLEDPRFVGNAADPALGFHAVGVDGIAFDEDQRHLYVDNLDYGTILRIDFDRGRPGAVSTVSSDPRLRGADGIAFDCDGNLLVAVNAQDQLASVDGRGDVTLLASGGILDGPSSLAFGQSEGVRRTLYVANSAFSRAFGFEAGTPHPAILEARTRETGLPLP